MALTALRPPRRSGGCRDIPIDDGMLVRLRNGRSPFFRPAKQLPQVRVHCCATGVAQSVLCRLRRFAYVRRPTIVERSRSQLKFANTRECGKRLNSPAATRPAPEIAFCLAIRGPADSEFCLLSCCRCRFGLAFHRVLADSASSRNSTVTWLADPRLGGPNALNNSTEVLER